MNARIPEKQVKKSNKNGRGRHPNTLLALAPTQFKPRQSGNPGGQRKGTVYVSEAYKRLGCMSLDALKLAQFTTAIETAVQQAILRAAEASDWQAAHAALKELADRVDGKAEQKKTVNESKTITVIFEKPEFANHDTYTPSLASENPTGIETLQRVGVRSALREIVVGAIPADGDGA